MAAHDFVANIRLLPTEAGGREGPLLSGEWRTILRVHDEGWSARLIFSGQPAPGQSFLSEVQLLAPELALPFFSVGAEFAVWEGSPKGVGQVVALAT